MWHSPGPRSASSQIKPTRGSGTAYHPRQPVSRYHNPPGTWLNIGDLDATPKSCELCESAAMILAAERGKPACLREPEIRRDSFGLMCLSFHVTPLQPRLFAFALILRLASADVQWTVVAKVFICQVQQLLQPPQTELTSVC